MLLSLTLFLTNCKKKSSNSTVDEPAPTPVTPASQKKYVLVIDNGAQSVDVGKTLTYNAHLVSSAGAVVNVSGISWSSNIGGMVGSNFILNNDTTGIISASVQYEGVTYSASVPICVQPLQNTQIFEVVPSAIIWSTNSGPIQLNTIYFGTSPASYAFSSDNSAIASVNSTGLITFNAVGNTRIKVMGTINGKVNEFYVPVMVVGVPEVPLPVTRIVVNPALGEMFRGETLALSAKAYNSNGDDVTNTVTFNYIVLPKIEEDEDPNATVTTTAITVSNTGVVTAKEIGGAYVKVTANGVQGQCEIVVNPDTVIIVSPFYTTLGTDYTQFPPVVKNSENFTATTYKVDRTAYRNHSPNFLTTIANPAGLKWDLPLTGIAEIDNLFNVVTLSNKSLTGCTATSIPNKIGSTFLVAHAGDLGGAASIMVNP